MNRTQPAISWLGLLFVMLALVPWATGCGGQKRTRTAGTDTAAEETSDTDEADSVAGETSGEDGAGDSSSIPGDEESATEIDRGREGNGEPYDPTRDEEPPVRVAEGGGREADSNSGMEEQPAVKKRPENVAKWKKVDYASAKAEQDPKLADAVAYLDKKYRGNDAAAKMLLFLLVSEPKKADDSSGAGETDRNFEGGDRGGRGGQDFSAGARGRGGSRGFEGGRGGGIGYDGEMIQVDAELARDIIAVLGRNNSKTARKGLHLLLKGEKPTPLDSQSLLQEILNAMLDTPHPEHEEVLFTLVTDPEKIIGKKKEDDYSVMSPESVRTTVLEQLRDAANEKMRTRFANYLNKEDIPEELVDLLEQMLTTEDQRNLPAQIIMYQSMLISDSAFEQIQTQLIGGSRSALGYIMGIDDVGIDGNYGQSGGRGRGFGGGREREGGGRRGGPRRGGPRRGGPRRMIRDTREVATGIAPLSMLFNPLGLNVCLNVSTQLMNENAAYADEGAGLRGRGGRERGRGRGMEGGEFGGGRGRGRGRGRGTRSNEPEFDPKIVYGKLASMLWTDEIAGQLGSELLDADSLSEKTESLKLLATMPTKEARKSLQALVKKYKDEPSSFASAGIMGQELTDPAFLLVAKEAYHSKKKKKRRSTRSSSSGNPGRGGGFGGGDGFEEVDPWQMEVENYVIALGERFAGAKSITKPVKAETEEEKAKVSRTGLGTPLPKGSEVTAEYHLLWPRDANKQLDGATSIAPLEIHYIRMEQEARPSRMKGLFKRMAGSGAKVHMQDNGVWFDGFIKNKTTEEVRSVDVRMFNTGDADSELKDTESREVMIEILVISIPGKELPSEEAKPTKKKPDASANAKPAESSKRSS